MEKPPQFRQMGRERFLKVFEDLAQEEEARKSWERASVDAQAHHVHSMGIGSLDDLTPSQRAFSEHIAERFSGDQYRGSGEAYSNSNYTFSIPTGDRKL